MGGVQNGYQFSNRQSALRALQTATPRSSNLQLQGRAAAKAAYLANASFRPFHQNSSSALFILGFLERLHLNKEFHSFKYI